jgi:uracil phosphoribosyltransferase
MPLHVVGHPLVEEVLAALRDRRTPPEEFRVLSRRVGLLVTVEATRDLPTREAEVETPLEAARVRRLGSRVVAVPVLRAGLGMLEAFLDLVPSAEVGYYGLERDEETATARSYYQKLPKDLEDAWVFLLDPMLATGGSAAYALADLNTRRARRVRMLSIVAAPEGLAHLEEVSPGAEIYAAALDRQLDDQKYIRPGLGDFGDRLFGT